MSKLRKAARGRECMVRIPGVCNGDPETVVLAHVRLAGECGMGMKPDDALGAWACSDCHGAVDGRVKTVFSEEELRHMHLEGMARTFSALRREGIL